MSPLPFALRRGLSQIRSVNRIIHAGQIPGAWVPPLQHLNTSSFATLTYIHLNIITILLKDQQAQGGLTISDPYLGLFDTPFEMFGVLEALTINFILQGSLDVHVGSAFGAQWGSLAHTLTRRGAFPKLKSVVIYVAIAASDGLGTASRRENRPLSNLFGECFLHLVKPQFQALEQLSSGGLLNFELNVGLIDGHSFAPI